MSPGNPAQKLPMLIGRRKEREQIALSIQGQGPPILFLEGRAGIGKTFLLNEAGRTGEKRQSLCPPIVDFYDTGMHSHQGLEAAIAHSLDPGEKAFEEYWTQRKQNPQADLWVPFLKGYKAALRDRHATLRFDTAELLEYEQDSAEVLQDCEVSPRDAPSWEWLLARISDLPNTTILIAARPTSNGLLKQRLLAAHGERVQIVEVDGLNLEETGAYLRATDLGQKMANDSPEIVARIYQLSEGRPILIALTLDWLQRGDWDRQKLFNIQPGSFEMDLVKTIRDLRSPLDRAVKFTALARKGFNAELLALLMEVPLEEAEARVQQLTTLSFVKEPRGERKLYFLHDEMYGLVERYVWKVDGSDDYSKQVELDQVIIEWYDGQIEALNEALKKLSKASETYPERAKLRRQQQLLLVERLYYQFDADPREGYRQYNKLDEEAIGSREMEWDALLRNEALWFTSYRNWRIVDWGPTRRQNGQIVRSPWVDHDCRRRWVNRYIARGEWEKAIRVTEKLLQKEAHPEEPELYRGGLKIALATAQTYVGGEALEPALHNFEEGVTNVEEAIRLSRQEHQNPWLSNYLLGSAYLYQGLALCNALRLNESARANARAINLFRNIEQMPRLAEALNNQSYVLARQGRSEVARSLCEEALNIRQELGDEYDIGLGLNTKGIIHERMDRPITAIHNSEEALDLFKEIGSERGIILADINLGRSYRRKARSPEWGQKDEDFEKGKDYLEEALSLQERLGTSADMFYRIEAYNEKGCLYRDWAATLQERATCSGRLQEYLALSEQCLEEAIHLTLDAQGQIVPGQEIQHIDSLEDLSRVFFLRARIGSEPDEAMLVRMNSLLAEAEAKAREYQRRREKWDELQLILGKIYFQRARLATLRQAWDQVASYYARAAGDIESYSLDAPELRKLVADATRWLSTLAPEETQHRVDQMREALTESNLKSDRLREWTNSVVLPIQGVEWPEN